MKCLLLVISQYINWCNLIVNIIIISSINSSNNNNTQKKKYIYFVGLASY